jgi:hypothetical protein
MIAAILALRLLRILAIHKKSNPLSRKAYSNVLVALDVLVDVGRSAGKDQTHLVYMKLVIDSKRLGIPGIGDVELRLQWHNEHCIYVCDAR